VAFILSGTNFTIGGSMKAKVWVLVALASVVLVGCANQKWTGEPRVFGKPPPPNATVLQCREMLCQVKVTVDSNCKLSVDTVISFGGQIINPRSIQWVIQDAGSTYKFTAPGSNPPPLVVKDPNDHAFATPGLLDEGRGMKVVFANNSPGASHEYGLNIVRSDGRTCGTPDPWVIE
jgi:hypothetical protein